MMFYGGYMLELMNFEYGHGPIDRRTPEEKERERQEEFKKRNTLRWIIKNLIILELWSAIRSHYYNYCEFMRNMRKALKYLFIDRDVQAFKAVVFAKSIARKKQRKEEEEEKKFNDFLNDFLYRHKEENEE
jgi:hypothetical protein